MYQHLSPFLLQTTNGLIGDVGVIIENSLLGLGPFVVEI